MAGWLMTAPAIVLLLVFLVAPIAMAAWVSLSDWTGIGSPFASGVHSVGTRNYQALLTQPGLPQQQLGESLRNNLYYVVLVVPLQTALALGRAAANTLLELSPETAEAFRRQIRRELHRLKLAGPGGVDVAAMRLRAYLGDQG